MDQRPPVIHEVTWEVYMKDYPFPNTVYVRFTCDAVDVTSGMNRVEMYIKNDHYDTIVGPGPIYEFDLMWSEVFRRLTFWFYHYDDAGNLAIVKFDPADVVGYPYLQSQHQQSNPVSKPRTTYQHNNG